MGSSVHDVLSSLGALQPEDIAARAGVSLYDLRALAADVVPHYRPAYSKVKRDGFGRVKRKNGKPEKRWIHPPGDELKAAQQALLGLVREHVPVLPCVYDVPRRGAVRGAKEHRGRSFHLATDLREFFPSIGSKRLRQALFALGATPEVARLITDLGTLHGRLPQGAPTSGDLASLAFRPADLDLLAFCHDRRLVYTRYADDLTVSGAHDFQGEVLELLGIVRSHRFRVRHDKTGYKRGPIEVTGVQVRQNVLRAPDSVTERAAHPDTNEKSRAGLLAYRDHVRST